jgi:hypothetical protein
VIVADDVGGGIWTAIQDLTGTTGAILAAGLHTRATAIRADLI